jgi:hypothetical protein
MLHPHARYVALQASSSLWKDTSDLRNVCTRQGILPPSELHPGSDGWSLLDSTRVSAALTRTGFIDHDAQQFVLFVGDVATSTPEGYADLVRCKEAAIAWNTTMDMLRAASTNHVAPSLDALVECAATLRAAPTIDAGIPQSNTLKACELFPAKCKDIDALVAAIRFTATEAAVPTTTTFAGGALYAGPPMLHQFAKRHYVALKNRVELDINRSDASMADVIASLNRCRAWATHANLDKDELAQLQRLVGAVVKFDTTARVVDDASIQYVDNILHPPQKQAASPTAP